MFPKCFLSSNMGVLVVYVGIMAGFGRCREVSPLAYVLGALFLAHLIWN